MQQNNNAKKPAAQVATSGKHVGGFLRPQYQAINSPIHRAVWEQQLPIELFSSKPRSASDDVRQVMDRSIEIGRGSARAFGRAVDDHVGTGGTPGASESLAWPTARSRGWSPPDPGSERPFCAKAGCRAGRGRAGLDGQHPSSGGNGSCD